MYQCIKDAHQLSWFQKNTKKENLEGGWFYCCQCKVQSAWIARKNMPSTVKWERLTQKDHLPPDQVRFVRKIGGEPNDYQLLRPKKPESTDRVPRERVRQRDLDRIRIDTLMAQVESLTVKLGNVERHRDTLLLRTNKLELELLEFKRRSGFKSKATAMPSPKLKGSVP